MSSLENWFKKHQHQCPPAEIQLFKDFMDGKINCRLAAISLTKNIEMKDKPNPLYDIIETLVALGVHSLDSVIQNKLVKLASAIRTIRKNSLKLGNKIPPCYYLSEIDEIIGDWWSCKYLCFLVIHLPTPVLILHLISVALRSDGEDLRRAETHSLWISINEFCAHLTKAEVCDWSHGATLLCDVLLDNPNLREEPILFAVALSAAAQHMIHAASNVYTFCELARTSWNLTYRWDEWKAMFKAAETVESMEAKSDVLAAVVEMDKAERLYKHRLIWRERGMTTRAMSQQSKQSRDIDGQPQQNNETTSGRKRGIDEAFPEFNESEMKMLSYKAIPV